MINPFASKKKEHVSPIGGAMGDFDEEFEQGLEDGPQRPQILGSIANFNGEIIPSIIGPFTREVVSSFYGAVVDLFTGDILPRNSSEQIQPSNPNIQAEMELKRLKQETVSFTRQRGQALEEASQRLSMQKQEKLMEDALRMGVNVIDVVTEVASNITNPIQAQREAARMRELGISDVVTVVNKVEVRDAQVEEAEKDQSLQAAQTSAIANAAEGGSGQVGSSTGALANLSTTGGGAG